MLDLDVLCLFLTSSLRGSDPGSPVSMRVDDFLFQEGLVTRFVKSIH